MGRRVEVVLTCDLHDEGDDEAATGTTRFAVDGTVYEFEACQSHRDEFDGALAPFIAISRRADDSGTGKRRGGSGAGSTGGAGTTGRSRAAGAASSLSDVRQWARAQGYEVSDRGRIPGEIRDAYDAAQP